MNNVDLSYLKMLAKQGKRLVIHWSDDTSLPTAVQLGFNDKSNQFNDFTFRASIIDMDDITFEKQNYFYNSRLVFLIDKYREDAKKACRANLVLPPDEYPEHGYRYIILK